MNIKEKKKKLLKLLDVNEISVREFYERFNEQGFKKEFKRLFKYRKKYFFYIISRFRPFQIKAETFWGENLWTTLPKELGLHLFGLLSKEIKLAKFLIKNFDENSVFFDVGAHCGFYSMLARQFLDKGQIHAFEPAPKIFGLLQKNLCGINETFLNPVALLDKDGETDFYEDLQGGGRSSCSFYNLISDPRHPPFKKIRVEAITLDKYCHKHLSPDLLKIDVEGSEQHVIEGGLSTLENANPIIAIEICRKPLDNQPHLDAMKILYNLNYKSYRINENGELELIKKINPEENIPEKFRWDNFIFKK